MFNSIMQLSPGYRRYHERVDGYGKIYHHFFLNFVLDRIYIPYTFTP
jgi:hypothetical protein